MNDVPFNRRTWLAGTALGTLAIGMLRGRLGWKQIKAALIGALRVSSAIMMIVVGAYLFGYFLTITQFTLNAVEFLVHLPVGPYGVLALIMVGYLILGAVMDELAMILLTVPIVFPAMMQLGFDPVWFGVIVVMAVTFGMICPPVGMNVFVINSIARDLPIIRVRRCVPPVPGSTASSGVSGKETALLPSSESKISSQARASS